MNSQPPTRVQLLVRLKAVTKLLESTGAHAEQMARLLAARGWPTGTLGDGTGSRSSAELTSVESAADHRDRWAGVDERLALFYVETFAVLGLGEQLLTDLAASAGSDEEHEGANLARTGTNGGWCIGCGRWVPGSSEDRLRGGACNACRMAWNRHVAENPDASRPLFMQNRPAHADPTARLTIDPTQPSTATTGGTVTPVDAGRVAEATRWHQGEVTTVEACERCGSVDPAVGPTGCPGSFHHRAAP